MPKKPIDYSKTIIYKLCCLDQNINDIYIGHTTDFNRRKSHHKDSCNGVNDKHYNYKVYHFIRANGGWDNWNMIQIEEYQCNNRREADARETFWMKELKSTLNSRTSFATKEEKKQQQKLYDKTEKRKEYQKQYKQTDKYKEQQKIYRETKALYLNELKCYNL
jgi:hypothetical protein